MPTVLVYVHTILLQPTEQLIRCLFGSVYDADYTHTSMPFIHLMDIYDKRRRPEETYDSLVPAGSDRYMSQRCKGPVCDAASHRDL